MRTARTRRGTTATAPDFPGRLHGQGIGLAVPAEFLAMLPYLATAAALVVMCRNPHAMLLNKPMSPGWNFKADQHAPAAPRARRQPA